MAGQTPSEAGEGEEEAGPNHHRVCDPQFDHHPGPTKLRHQVVNKDNRHQSGEPSGRYCKEPFSALIALGQQGLLACRSLTSWSWGAVFIFYTVEGEPTTTQTTIMLIREVFLAAIHDPERDDLGLGWGCEES